MPSTSFHSYILLLWMYEGKVRAARERESEHNVHPFGFRCHPALGRCRVEDGGVGKGNRFSRPCFTTTCHHVEHQHINPWDNTFSSFISIFGFHMSPANVESNLPSLQHGTLDKKGRHVYLIRNLDRKHRTNTHTRTQACIFAQCMHLAFHLLRICPI